jgi:hypothetical protein
MNAIVNNISARLRNPYEKAAIISAALVMPITFIGTVYTIYKLKITTPETPIPDTVVFFSAVMVLFISFVPYVFTHIYLSLRFAPTKEIDKVFAIQIQYNKLFALLNSSVAAIAIPLQPHPVMVGMVNAINNTVLFMVSLVPSPTSLLLLFAALCAYWIYREQQRKNLSE